MEAGMITGLVLLTLVGVHSVEQNIHENMTPIEKMQIFHTDKKIPEYEIISIYWPEVQKRSTNSKLNIRLKAFDEDLDLWMNPVDGILFGDGTPIYIARNEGSGLKLSKYSNVTEKIVTRMYEDLQYTATLVICESSERGKSIVGTIGKSGLTISPLPDRLVGDVVRHRRSIDVIHESEMANQHYHIVYKNEPDPEISNYLNSLKSFNLIKQNRFIPDIVYPEILVVVDNSLLEKVGSNVFGVIPYVLAFWNGVDMKFRGLESPKWRLNIAGIVLAENADALSYVEDNRWGKFKLPAIEAASESGRFWYQQNEPIPVDSYDALVTMTTYSLCHKTQNKCLGAISGVALIGAACHVDHERKQVMKVALIQDRGGYSGIYTAAHELGHLFGADHDGIGNDACLMNDGFIMAASPQMTRNSSDWSPCSLDDFQQFLESEPSCMYNKPDVGNIIPSFLPGQLMNADQQCANFEGTRACSVGPEICHRLGCVSSEDPSRCKSVSAAAEGTPCSDGKFCIHGECITSR